MYSEMVVGTPVPRHFVDTPRRQGVVDVVLIFRP